MRYTGPQLRVLLALAVVMLAGLAIQEWRAGFPDLAERLERFDREDPVDPAPRQPARPAVRPAADVAADRAPAPPGGGAPDRRGQPPGLVDLNRAPESELAELPGLGAHLARRIVEERERHGGFESPEALRRVYGLGPRKLAAIRDRVTASAPAAPRSAVESGREGGPAERPAPATPSPADPPSGAHPPAQDAADAPG